MVSIISDNCDGRYCAGPRGTLHEVERLVAAPVSPLRLASDLAVVPAARNRTSLVLKFCLFVWLFVC
jgi:hypothetical protein